MYITWRLVVYFGAHWIMHTFPHICDNYHVDIISVLLQNRLRWYGHVLQTEDNDWVKKCMEYEVEGARPRGKPKRSWREVVQKDCQARKLNVDDAMDCT